jgi:hypothetical protein
MLHVLELSPWNIRGHPPILKYWDPSMTLSELDFANGEYWIQVHDLPLELMTSLNAEILGGQLGTLLEKESFWREFIRIKVLIPLLQPLVSGFLHERQCKLPTWVQLKYERLFKFCFNCGRLGHIKIFCPAWSLSNIPQRFSLNAPPYVQVSSTPTIPSHLLHTLNHKPDTPSSILDPPIPFSKFQLNPHVFKSLITDIEDISDLCLEPSTCPDPIFPQLAINHSMCYPFLKLTKLPSLTLPLPTLSF